MSVRFIPLLVLSVGVAGLAHAAAYPEPVTSREILTTTTTASGRGVIYPRTDRPVVSVLTVEIPGGAETGWHSHPSPSYVWVASGEVTLELEGGKSIRYQEGTALIGAVNTPQNLKNSGSTPNKLLVFFTGAADVPNIVKTTVYESGQARAEPPTIVPTPTIRQQAPAESQQKPEPVKKEDNSINIRLRYQQPVIE